MEKVVAVAGTQHEAGSRWELAAGAGVAALLAASMLCPAARAQDAAQAPAPVLVAEARTDQPAVRMQVRTSALPRLDAQDAGFQAPRVDLSLMTTTPGGSGLGPVLGVSTTGAGQPLGLQARTGVDLGVRWSQRLQSQHQIDVTAWRRMNAPDDAYSLIQMRQPVYGARVEMNLARAKSGINIGGLAIDRGFVGMQLEGGGRITIKRKDGRPMVYYRTTF